MNKETRSGSEHFDKTMLDTGIAEIYVNEHGTRCLRLTPKGEALYSSIYGEDFLDMDREPNQ